MEDTAYNITKQYLSLLKTRIQYNNSSYLKQLENQGRVVFKYEDPSLLVSPPPKKKEREAQYFLLQRNMH